MFILLLVSELLGGRDHFFVVVSCTMHTQNKYLLKVQISSIVRSEEAFADGSMPFLLSSPSSDLQGTFMKSEATFRRIETKTINP